ncbi:MAG: iron-containing alcohol dehydrogenase [Pirellulales bacterium]
MLTAPLHYDFLSPARIVFGWGKRVEAGAVAASLGRRALVVVGSRTLESNGTLEEVLTSLRASGLEATVAGRITREPEVQDVDRLAAELRSLSAGEGDLLLALGGGSAIDLAKAGAALAVNRQSDSVQDYLEGVGRGLKLVSPPLPLLAMPTTSGTGSEATKNAVISSYQPAFKKSLRDNRLIPRAVLVDPELSVSVPANVTAWTGMDAITQLIESYVTRKSNAMTQGLCLAGLRLAVPAIEQAVRDSRSRPAREAMAQAALLSGMALANSGLGLAHGVAAALGVTCRVPHGLACAVLLPAAMRINRSVRQAEFAVLGELFTGKSFSNASAAADSAVERIEQLCAAVGIPRRLSDLGVKAEQLPELVRGSHGNSMSGNPVELSDDALKRLLEELL